MKKIVALLLISFLYLFANQPKEFLEPHEAFKPKIYENNTSIIFEVELGKDIYLYDDKLRVFVSKPTKVEVTKDAIIPKPVKYEKQLIHFGTPNVVVEISKNVLEKAANSSDYEVEFLFQGCTTEGLCYMPMKEKFGVGKIENTKTIQKTQKLTKKELSESDFIASTLKNSSTLVVLATFFVFGVLLSLTPCIFPMIPILSSIIIKANGEKELTLKRGLFLSFLYVFAMSFAYAIAGVIAGLFGANLQVALQNPYVLTIFAIVFVLLALSMFGYFTLEAPKWLQNRVYKTTKNKEKSGVVGILIMGFLSALIVGPCVAPPLAGALIYIGQTGDAILGGLALFIMSLGMGLPLLIIGAGAGKIMPKAGRWMAGVSKIFGIVLLGVAIWLLERVIYGYALYLWAFLLIGTSIYLHQEYTKHILLKTLALVVFLYGVFAFIGGVSGANDILNPLENLIQNKTTTQKDKLEWQHIDNLQDFQKILQTSTKPIMLDFYATWCVSCKDLEDTTLQDHNVATKLKDFVLVKADVTNNSLQHQELQKYFGIFGPPALIFFDTNKQEVKVARVIGYKNADDLLGILNQHF